jgi:hypothetical protein
MAMLFLWQLTSALPLPLLFHFFLAKHQKYDQFSIIYNRKTRFGKGVVKNDVLRPPTAPSVSSEFENQFHIGLLRELLLLEQWNVFM